MATISDALRSGILCEYRLPDWELRDPLRKLYHHPDFFDHWADTNAVMNDISKGSGQRTRTELLEQLFCEWRCARRPSGYELKRIRPVDQGVCKLHPYKARIYGWFTMRGEFVAISGATEEATKENKKLTDLRRDEVLKFIRNHKLQEECFQGEIYEIIEKARR